MKLKPTVANLVNSSGDMNLEDREEETDDEILHSTYTYMVKQRVSVDPPSDVIDVKAHFEYGDTKAFKDSDYAISDGGADSCILDRMAKVLEYTGRHANLVGHDPRTTRINKVPIVLALLKAKSAVVGEIPVLLRVNEVPYNKNSPITLLSEYQVRKYGLSIDSVAKKHQSSINLYGTQLFQLSADVYINFEDKGGLMGFQLLHIEPGDEDIIKSLPLLAL